MARRVSKSQAPGDTLAAPYPPSISLIWTLLLWCSSEEEWCEILPEIYNGDDEFFQVCQIVAPQLEDEGFKL